MCCGARCLHGLKPGTTAPRRAISTEAKCHMQGSISALLVLVLSKGHHAEEFLNYVWWVKIKLKATRRPRRLSCFLRNLRPGMISKKLSANESWQCKMKRCLCIEIFPDGSVVKNSPANPRDVGSISGSGRHPGEKNGNPFQYSSLGDPMDRGSWLATVHGVTKKSDMI